MAMRISGICREPEERVESLRAVRVEGRYVERDGRGAVSVGYKWRLRRRRAWVGYGCVATEQKTVAMGRQADEKNVGGAQRRADALFEWRAGETKRPENRTLRTVVGARCQPDVGTRRLNRPPARTLHTPRSLSVAVAWHPQHLSTVDTSGASSTTLRTDFER